MIKEKINEAYNLAKERHKGQFRKNSKLPYFSHPKYVARMVERLTNDETLIIVALLHDVVEDTDTKLTEINTKFGTRVASLVNELTNSKEERGNLKKKVYMKIKMMKMSLDALTVKLADRFHNLLFLEKDCKTKDHKQFAIYYITNSDFIFKSFNRELNDVTKALILRIQGLIGCLKIQYNIK